MGMAESVRIGNLEAKVANLEDRIEYLTNWTQKLATRVNKVTGGIKKKPPVKKYGVMEASNA